jgi:hypothetical protein
MQSGGAVEEPPAETGSGRMWGRARKWRRARQSNATSSKPSANATQTLMSKLIVFKILGDHITSSTEAPKAAIVK